MNESKLQDSLSKPRRIIIITEFPTMHKIAGKTWKKETVWRLALLTPASHFEMRCHSVEELLRELAQVLNRRRGSWSMKDRMKQNVLEAVLYRIRAFGER